MWETSFRSLLCSHFLKLHPGFLALILKEATPFSEIGCNKHRFFSDKRLIDAPLL
jgi:hypothetical protein